MIDEIINNLFQRWNEENKCDNCWKLVRTFNDHYNAKGTTNIYKPSQDDVCCVHVFWEGLTTKNTKDINNNRGYSELLYCDYNLHFKIVKQENFEKSKADEVGCDENIYSDTIKPIMDCLDCEFESDICTLFDGSSGVVFNESMKPYFSYGSENWAGVDYYVTVRIYK